MRRSVEITSTPHFSRSRQLNDIADRSSCRGVNIGVDNNDLKRVRTLFDRCKSPEPSPRLLQDQVVSVSLVHTDGLLGRIARASSFVGSPFRIVIRIHPFKFVPSIWEITFCTNRIDRTDWSACFTIDTFIELMKSIVTAKQSGSSFVGCMRSTGRTATHAAQYLRVAKLNLAIRVGCKAAPRSSLRRSHAFGRKRRCQSGDVDARDRGPAGKLIE
jgi:hypothetical protein